MVLGGTAPAAIRRAGRIGDGFFPAIIPTERVFTDLPGMLELLRDSARAAGREPSSIEITSGGARTVKEARWFVDQGVHRLTIAVRSKTAADMREELLRFGDEVIRATTDL